MEKIALITDSACDLTFDEIQKNNINMIPFRIIYSYGEYEDKITITPKEVYNSFKNEIPTTSLPSMEQLNDLLNELEADGYTHLIAITISSGLSGTFNALRLYIEERTSLKYFLYDTSTLSIAEGSIVLDASKMIANGNSFDEIIATLPSLRKKTHTFFTLDTLEYLIKGGRIGKVTGTLGQILDLKPIIKVGDDGIYHNHSKVRGRKKSLNTLIDIVNSYTHATKCKVWIVQGDALDDAKIFKDKISNNPNVIDVEITECGPALVVHTGPGLIGMVIKELN
ncbi:MAG: DegV family protein [Clostridium sp.]